MGPTGYACLNAAITKPVAETRVRERSPTIVHKIGHLTARLSINDLLQGWENGQHKSRGLPIATFELRQRDLIVANVLTT